MYSACTDAANPAGTRLGTTGQCHHTSVLHMRSLNFCLRKTRNFVRLCQVAQVAALQGNAEEPAVALTPAESHQPCELRPPVSHLTVTLLDRHACDPGVETAARRNQPCSLRPAGSLHCLTAAAMVLCRCANVSTAVQSSGRSSRTSPVLLACCNPTHPSLSVHCFACCLQVCRL